MPGSLVALFVLRGQRLETTQVLTSLRPTMRRVSCTYPRRACVPRWYPATGPDVAWRKDC